MDASAIKRAFSGPVSRGNLTWHFHSRGRQWPRQKLTITFIADERSFKGWLSKKMSASEDWRSENYLSEETLAILRSLLSTKNIAACTAAALNHRRIVE